MNLRSISLLFFFLQPIWGDKLQVNFLIETEFSHDQCASEVLNQGQATSANEHILRTLLKCARKVLQDFGHTLDDSDFVHYEPDRKLSLEDLEDGRSLGTCQQCLGKNCDVCCVLYWCGGGCPCTCSCGRRLSEGIEEEFLNKMEERKLVDERIKEALETTCSVEVQEQNKNLLNAQDSSGNAAPNRCLGNDSKSLKVYADVHGL
jgi:hypothetical protein